MAHYMGIDIGTSGTRAIIINNKGRIIGAASSAHPSYAPKPAWSEQNPADWWKTTCKSVRKALKAARLKRGDIAGIGLSGQMHGAVLLDKADKVLRPAILWTDQRTGDECEEMTKKVGLKRLMKVACNPALTGFTAPKILWVRKNEPRIYDKTRKVLLPKDYIRLLMTGEYATEVSDASGTLLLDIARRAWSREILSKLQIPVDFLPNCYESQEVSGKLTRDGAKQLGLTPGTPVVGGGGDQAAGAVGNGIVRTGVISATMGTSGVVFAFSDKIAVDPAGRLHTFCHAVPGKWHVMGCVLAAGGSFQWFRNNLAHSEIAEAKRRAIDPYELLTRQAAKAPAGCEGLLWLPYLTGERTPHADPDARAGWIGITQRHTRPDLVRAVMEGATFSMRDSLEIIKEMNVKVNEIRLSGGGARSQFWRQMQADVYGQTVSIINATEGPAFGVALLAAVGTGGFKSVPEACRACIRTVQRIKPNLRSKKTYNDLYTIYRALYPALKAEYKKMSAFSRKYHA